MCVSVVGGGGWFCPSSVTVPCVLSSFAIISLRKRVMVDLLLLCMCLCSNVPSSMVPLIGL